MKNKFIAIWRIIFSYDFLVMTDISIIGITHDTSNGKYIKSLIEATLKAKKGDA